MEIHVRPNMWLTAANRQHLQRLLTALNLAQSAKAGRIVMIKSHLLVPRHRWSRWWLIFVLPGHGAGHTD
jgi:hypothetical protein